MDTMLTTLFGWQFLFFCISIAAITEVIRRIIEYIIVDFKGVPGKVTIWSDLILPILPTILGVLVAILAKKYPFPDDIHSLSGRIAFGLVSGVLSSLVYRVMKAFLVGNIVRYKQGLTQGTYYPPQQYYPPQGTNVISPTTVNVIGSPDAPIDPTAAAAEAAAVSIRQTINKG